jgi:hypothetical protein
MRDSSQGVNGMAALKAEEYVEVKVDEKTAVKVEEHFDVLDEKGNLTGRTKAR